MSFSYGRNIRVTLGGGSHERAVSVYIEGIPMRSQIDMAKVQNLLDMRAPGQGGLSTARRETDVPVILDGLIQPPGTSRGSTRYTVTGPIKAEFLNGDVQSGTYESYIPRPGHGDYPAWVKNGAYGALPDGGATSARMTVGLVFAGAIVMQLLEKRGIRISAEAELPEAQSRAGEGDSFGGKVRCRIEGLPVGLGESYFDGLESRIASAVFAIPAVKAVEFGAGVKTAEMLGSEYNDAFYFDENGRVKTKTNNCGGILGGMADGMPVEFAATFKPTPSIALEQDSIDLFTGENVKLNIRGRHDRCVVPRAVPIVAAVSALVIFDAMLET